MHTVDQVVGRHDAPRAALLHSSLEGGQVNLVQRARVDLLVDAVALKLLVVGVEVLHRGDHALALHALHIGRAQLPSKIRIFAVTLEVAPPQRHAVDVHRRPQDHVPAQRLHFLRNGLALALNQLRVPGCGHGHA